MAGYRWMTLNRACISARACSWAASRSNRKWVKDCALTCSPTNWSGRCDLADYFREPLEDAEHRVS